MAALRTASHQTLLRSRFGSRLLRSGRGNPEAVLERALTRRHESALVVDTMYRSLLGRPASPEELAAMRSRASHGVGFDELLAELVTSEDSTELLMARSGPAFRAKLRRQFAQADGSATAGRLVFLHIMRVGGTSLSDSLQRWVEPDRSRVHVYVDDLVLTPPPILAQLRVLAGHIPYAALPLIPGPYSTLCVLRDPYARTISHFALLRRARDQYRDLTLDEFVSSDEFDVPSGNYQARQLAHDMDITEAWRSYSPEDLYRARGGEPLHQYPLQSLFDSVSVGFNDDELLRRATENLAQIDYVGVTEHLDTVGTAISELLGVKAEQMPRLNASPPSEAREIDARIRRRIDERTAVDRQLYEAASKRSRQLT